MIWSQSQKQLNSFVTFEIWFSIYFLPLILIFIWKKLSQKSRSWFFILFKYIQISSNARL